MSDKFKLVDVLTGKHGERKGETWQELVARVEDNRQLSDFFLKVIQDHADAEGRHILDVLGTADEVEVKLTINGVEMSIVPFIKKFNDEFSAVCHRAAYGILHEKCGDLSNAVSRMVDAVHDQMRSKLGLIDDSDRD